MATDTNELEGLAIPEVDPVPVNVPPPSTKPSHWREYVCGGGSACCNLMITYPLNKLIFRQVSFIAQCILKSRIASGDKLTTFATNISIFLLCLHL